MGKYNEWIKTVRNRNSCWNNEQYRPATAPVMCTSLSKLQTDWLYTGCGDDCQLLSSCVTDCDLGTGTKTLHVEKKKTFHLKNENIQSEPWVTITIVLTILVLFSILSNRIIGLSLCSMLNPMLKLAFLLNHQTTSRHISTHFSKTNQPSHWQ